MPLLLITLLTLVSVASGYTLRVGFAESWGPSFWKGFTLGSPAGETRVGGPLEGVRRLAGTGVDRCSVVSPGVP